MRTPVFAALAAFCLAAPSALAATTDQQKFEKKVGRYAQPVSDLDFTKPRGLCTCGPNDPVGVAGQTGVLTYGFEGVSSFHVRVVCQIPVFGPVGDLVGSTLCEDWTLLSR